MASMAILFDTISHTPNNHLSSIIPNPI